MWVNYSHINGLFLQVNNVFSVVLAVDLFLFYKWKLVIRNSYHIFPSKSYHIAVSTSLHYNLDTFLIAATVNRVAFKLP